MQDGQEYEINGSTFAICMASFVAGKWLWTNEEFNDEGALFDCPIKALQNAMRYMTDKRIDEELAAEEASNDEKYGTERDQIRDYYKSSRL